LRVWLQSLKKYLYDRKNKLFEKIKKISKNAEFHADFKAVEKVFFFNPQKSYKQKKFNEHE
jgi:hypothetical protein